MPFERSSSVRPLELLLLYVLLDAEELVVIHRTTPPETAHEEQNQHPAIKPHSNEASKKENCPPFVFAEILFGRNCKKKTLRFFFLPWTVGGTGH